MSFFNVNDIRRAVTEAGSHFFDPATMRFFRSRLLSRAVCGPSTGLYYFVTSERFSDSTPRRYTVRVFNPKQPAQLDTMDGHADGFQKYATARAARAAARKAP